MFVLKYILPLYGLIDTCSLSLQLPLPVVQSYRSETLAELFVFNKNIVISTLVVHQMMAHLILDSESLVSLNLRGQTLYVIFMSLLFRSSWDAGLAFVEEYVKNIGIEYLFLFSLFKLLIIEDILLIFEDSALFYLEVGQRTVFFLGWHYLLRYNKRLIHHELVFFRISLLLICISFSMLYVRKSSFGCLRLSDHCPVVVLTARRIYSV